MVLKFSTTRMHLYEISPKISPSSKAYKSIICVIPKLFSPLVVKNLPPYFHTISSTKEAEIWFNKMLQESRLFLIQTKEETIIGFLFIYEAHSLAHIGYLLKENYWKKGLGTELLKAFIHFAKKHEKWQSLLAGVDKNNQPSSHLLEKIGFELQVEEENVSQRFYRYHL